MVRTLVLLSVTAVVVVLAAPVAMSGPAAGPAESGAVTRRASTGVVAFMDPEGVLGGQRRPLVAFFNVADTAQFCRMEAAGDVVLQHVNTPSGRENVLLHDDAHPVLVFDVAALGTTPEVVFPQLSGAVCDDGLAPVAAGVVRVRNKVHVGSDGEVLALFDAAGQIGGAAEWSLTAHRRLRVSASEHSEPTVEIHARIRLVQRRG